MFIIYSGVHGYQKSFDTLEEAISAEQASKLLGAPIIGDLK
jgi:hypothetical protein